MRCEGQEWVFSIAEFRRSDLADLKVEAFVNLLRPMKVSQSSFLKVGQQCLAIGNPFGGAWWIWWWGWWLSRWWWGLV
ncbi:putative peptidase S1, PA clan [Helianthus annuus]|uniref:Peptidase S1, PA clan n=1 Tax=Helianthus annuus TaxID=4232 RepID=A0A251SLG4_HELAN|nr:putative peptidase S1, PA clan [Helianthus annuus]